jgi:hypothetical protein
MLRRFLAWLKRDPVFVLRDHELEDPWKVEVRDALNARDSERVKELLALADEKQLAERRAQVH